MKAELANLQCVNYCIQISTLQVSADFVLGWEIIKKLEV